MTKLEDKVRAFERKIAFFQGFSQAHAKIEMAIESTRLRGIPTSAVLIGPSGSGKSTLCNIIKNSFPETSIKVEPDRIVHTIPALYCCVPAKVTIKSFCKVMVSSLDCPDTRGDTEDLFLRLIKLIKTCQTEIVFIDEFHTLADPENEKQLTVLINWLVSLINRLSIPIICAGTDACKYIIYKEDRLARRYPFLAELSYVKFDQNPNSEFMTLLRLLDEQLYQIGNLATGAHLTDTNISTPLHVATQGNLEYIRQILSRAFTTCLARRSLSLQKQDFHDACSTIELKLCPCRGANPFSLSISNCYALLEGRRQ
ncbi:TniB family NTP-binding protein [Pseudomonas pseudonitroreducens]|uniref:TniB family NTP-binding protein n=1 Tax=Pseudomonas pseudonitroreducens TaxID=2892326 RepID=UPI001F3AC00B|nr:TniB family NTP-binding protein [Pseudomonas pseudonitroreducens]